MNELNAAKYAGNVLRKLIKENYSSQEEFADEFGTVLRVVNRYVNEGINKLSVLQELAFFFGVDLKDFIPSTVD